MISKVFNIGLIVMGIVDLFYAYQRLTKGLGKVLQKFDKIEDITIVLIVSGIVCLGIGIYNLVTSR